MDDAFCPVGEEADTGKFQIASEINSETPIVQQYVAFCKHHNIDVAGIEFVENEAGEIYTYDINCTTNYNSNVEEKLGFSGMDVIVDLAEQRWNEFCATKNQQTHQNEDPFRYLIRLIGDIARQRTLLQFERGSNLD